MQFSVFATPSGKVVTLKELKGITEVAFSESSAKGC